MKKIILFVLLLFTIAACQQKEKPKSRYQPPSVPFQSRDEIKLLQEAVRKDPHNGEAWIKLGNELMDSSHFNDAIDAYQRALDIDPKNVDARVDMGVCYRKTGRSDVAVKEIKKAIEYNPGHVMAHKNLAIILAYDFKDNAQAIKEFEKSLRLAPNAPDADRVREEIQRLKAGR
jgi:tetratricopeptide (TPR) repeat protein